MVGNKGLQCNTRAWAGVVSRGGGEDKRHEGKGKSNRMAKEGKGGFYRKEREKNGAGSKDLGLRRA